MQSTNYLPSKEQMDSTLTKNQSVTGEGNNEQYDQTKTKLEFD